MEPADLQFVLYIFLWSAGVFILACIVEWFVEWWKKRKTISKKEVKDERTEK